MNLPFSKQVLLGLSYGKIISKMFNFLDIRFSLLNLTWSNFNFELNRSWLQVLQKWIGKIARKYPWVAPDSFFSIFLNITHHLKMVSFIFLFRECIISKHLNINFLSFSWSRWQLLNTTKICAFYHRYKIVLTGIS